MKQGIVFREEEDFHLCRFDEEADREAFCRLLNEYMCDPMGDAEPLDEERQKRLLEGMASHPSSVTLMLTCDGRTVGLINGFFNFSTFKAKPFLSIHDVYVDREYRGRGLSRRMMGKMTEIACDNGCSKITLEVREDNVPAQRSYKSEGYGDGDHKMYFWEKYL